MAQKKNITMSYNEKGSTELSYVLCNTNVKTTPKWVTSEMGDFVSTFHHRSLYQRHYKKMFWYLAPKHYPRFSYRQKLNITSTTIQVLVSTHLICLTASTFLYNHLKFVYNQLMRFNLWSRLSKYQILQSWQMKVFHIR